MALSFKHKFAGHLFILAREAAKRAHIGKGTIGEQIEAATTVVLCVLVAEAGINEIADWYEFHRSTPPFSVPHGLPKNFKDRRIRTKWLEFPHMVRQRKFDEGVEPWQSFKMLVDLRNYFVHLTDPTPKKPLQDFLNARFSGELNASVAKWACDTIAAMFEKLTVLIDPPQQWINLTWLWTPTHSFPYGLSTPGDPWPDDAK